MQDQAAHTMLTSMQQAADSVLLCTLENGILRDQYGRTGSVVANRQFQFDGPPQAGAIYTGGFSICQNNSLAIGGSTRWFRCMSGDFGNLYDESIGEQCAEIRIVVDFISDPSPSSSLVLPASTTLSLIPTGETGIASSYPSDVGTASGAPSSASDSGTSYTSATDASSQTATSTPSGSAVGSSSVPASGSASGTSAPSTSSAAAAAPPAQEGDAATSSPITRGVALGSMLAVLGAAFIF